MNDLTKKQQEIMNYSLKITKTITYSRITLNFYENNLIMYILDDKKIDWFHSLAETKNNSIDTRDAKRVSIKKKII